MSFSCIFHYLSHHLAGGANGIQELSLEEGWALWPPASVKLCMFLNPCTGAGSCWVTPKEGPSLQSHLPHPWLTSESAACRLHTRETCFSSSSAARNEVWQPPDGPGHRKRGLVVVSKLHHLCWNTGPVLDISSSRGMKGRFSYLSWG